MEKGNEFIVHPNIKEGLANPLHCSRCLTLLINNCKGKWDAFIADDKIVEDEFGTWMKAIDYEDH